MMGLGVGAMKIMKMVEGSTETEEKVYAVCGRSVMIYGSEM